MSDDPVLAAAHRLEEIMRRLDEQMTLLRTETMARFDRLEAELVEIKKVVRLYGR